MAENQSLLEQLQQMLIWKKSKKFYAEKLGVTEADVDEMISEIRKKAREEAEVGVYISELEDRIVKFEEDLIRGTGEMVFNSKEEIKSLEDLIEKCKIDTKRWEITKYVQNFWGNVEQPHFQVKAWLAKKSNENLFQENFIEFLKSYVPENQAVTEPDFDLDKSDAMLIINKQDSHLNKFDVGGDNHMVNRMSGLMYKVEIVAKQAALSNNLEKITYIIGSDEFNSEYTNATTKGTPQTNIAGYHEGFKMVCDHEISMISMLLKYGEEVNVVYVAGNHDEFVGWHLVNWLKMYFRNEPRVVIEDSPKYRKYVNYGVTAMMFNHGDAIKPAKLAAIFPIEHKNTWSAHNHFYIFTGDKHHEVSHDFNGIKFYQIPAFSSAKSLWDDKNGHVCAKGEVTAFLIDEDEGMTNIFKQYLTTE